MQKTKKEIIDETVAYYSEDPSRRSLGKTGIGCYYKNTQGNMCAVGRCFDWERMTPEMAAEIAGYPSFYGQFAQEVGSFFKPEYDGHATLFWCELQHLHDHNDNWTGEGISYAGKLAVEFLHSNWDHR